MSAVENMPADDSLLALEQSNLLLTTITYNLPQIVLILAEDSYRVVYKNYHAAIALETNQDFLAGFQQMLRRKPQGFTAGQAVEFAHRKQFFSVTLYPLLWKGTASRACLFNDISGQRLPGKEEKTPAHIDPLTGLHNRLAGIMVLNKWLDSKRAFALCLANLDNIRYVNDICGKQEGNRYILAATSQLLRFSAGAVVTRTGGDEFMVLAPDFTQVEAEATMEDVCRRLQEAIREKSYYSNMSYGVVAVAGDSAETASSLLSRADERMCAAKALNKKRRMLMR